MPKADAGVRCECKLKGDLVIDWQRFSLQRLEKLKDRFPAGTKCWYSGFDKFHRTRFEDERPIYTTWAYLGTISEIQHQQEETKDPASMSDIEMLMPKMGESIGEATIVRWVKNVGDTVKKDETILEISTGKVGIEVPAPASGTISEILYQADDTVEVGKVIARIRDCGTDPSTKEEGEKTAAKDFWNMVSAARQRYYEDNPYADDDDLDAAIAAAIDAADQSRYAADDALETPEADADYDDPDYDPVN